MWKLVVVALIACSSKSSTPVADRSPPPPAVARDAAIAAKPARAKPTKEQLAEAHTHMKAGWAAQKDHKWADAVPEFEAALKILDGDARALSELGWSAMNAGDYAKARKADDEAVLAAVEPKLKAAGLYNLGLVQLKLNDKDGALRSFRTSLQLRPNKIVEGEITKLGASPAAAPPACVGTKGCACAESITFGTPMDVPDACTEKPSPVPSFHLYSVDVGNSSTVDILLDEHDQLVANVGGGRDSTHNVSQMTLDKLEVKAVGGHQVLWIETTDVDETDYMTENNWDEQHLTVHAITVCAIGDAKTATTCAVREAPASFVSTTTHSTMTEDGTPTSTKEDHAETTLDVALADDGTVTVKLVKGSADNLAADLLGPHKLW